MLSALIAVALVLLALASTVGAGLELTAEPPSHSARSVLAVVLVNVVVLPLATAWALARFELPTETRTALWLVALAPGGASSPLLARAAGANASVVAWGYLALALVSPALVWAGFARTAPSLDGRTATLAMVSALQVLPVVLSSLVARRAPRATRFARPLRSLGNITLATVIALLLFDRGPMLATLDRRTLGAMFALAAASTALGAMTGVANASLTIVRNLTLALIVSELCGPRAVAILVAAYGLVMYLTAAAASLAARRRTTHEARLSHP